MIQRWVSRGQEGEAASNGQVPVRYPKHRDGTDASGPLSRLFTSNPAIDLEETDDEVVVMADLPGLDPHDFSVEVTGERLVIRGEKTHDSTDERRGYCYHQQHYGAFARAFKLPCEIDVDKAQADYRRGLLRVTLPKTERAKTKRAKIQICG